jgi:hypothetical protein
MSHDYTASTLHKDIAESSSSLTVTHIQSPMLRLERLRTINDPVISEFVSSIPTNFSELVRLMLRFGNTTIDQFVLNNRFKLKQAIQKFHHQAGTLTANLSEKISLLTDPTTQILVSTHQPNLFPYSGVCKKIVLLETLKNALQKIDQNKKIINLFIVIDHEFADDRWVRHAQLPSIHHPSGILQLTAPVSRKEKRQLIKNIGKPSSSVLSEWERRIRSSIRYMLDSPIMASPLANSATSLSNLRGSELLSNFDYFWAEVELAYSKSISFADFNAFLLSQIVNNVFGYSTLFLRLTEMSTAVEGGIKYLIANFDTYSKILKNTEKSLINNGIKTRVSPNVYDSAPVWLHCKCGSKASSKIIQNKQNLALIGSCLGCGKHLVQNIGNLASPDVSDVIENISLRAIPIPLLLSRDIGIACYATGTGGVGYLTDTHVISRGLSIPSPIITLWAGRDIYNGMAQSIALKSLGMQDSATNQPIQLYINRLKQNYSSHAERIKVLIEERERMIRNNIPINNVLADLFALKQEQRHIRKNIEQAQQVNTIVDLSPCLIDYAINFGIDNVEKYWRQYLLENSDLITPTNYYPCLSYKR